MCKKTHAHLHYAFNSCAKFQNECLKTPRGLDYTILLPLNETHLQYAYSIFAKFQIDCLKTLGGVDYTNSIPYNAKSCLKLLSSKGCNSVKINSSSTKNPHAHLQYVQNRYARFQKGPLKTVGGVDYTNSIP